MTDLNKADFDKVDLDELGKTIGIKDHGILKRLFGMFFASTDEDLAQISSAVDIKNYKQMQSVAHKIKGAARNLRLSIIGDTAELIEQKAKNSEESEYDEAVERLRTQIANSYSYYKEKYSL